MTETPQELEKMTDEELRFHVAHTLVFQERIYDALLLIIDKLYDDDGKTAQKLIQKHAKHEYKWPEA